MDTAFHIKRFAFDRVFDAVDARAPAPEAHDDLLLRVLALEADLALAQAEAATQIAAARAAGYEEGLADARGSRELALIAAVDALHASVETVEAGLDGIAQTAAREAASVALAAADHLAGRAIAAAPGAAIDAAIGRVLSQVARGQEIQVSVAPAMVAEIERLITARQSGDRRRLALVVIADASVPEGDAHIHWDQGGVILNAAERRAAVAEALDGLQGECANEA